MKGFAKFQQAMVKAAQEHFRPAMEAEREALGEVLRNEILNLDGPRYLNRKLTGRQIYFGRAFRGFFEISKSLETLDDIAFYIGRFPFQNTRMSREKYLQFHVEAHLAEIYVLRERLKRYLALLERQHKGDSRLSTVRLKCKALLTLITESLKGVINVRGQHVHEARFADPGIDRLATLSLLSHGSDDDEFTRFMKLHYRIEHRKVKKLWKQRAINNNKAIRELLDIFFDRLFPVVFDEKTHAFNYPTRLKT